MLLRDFHGLTSYSATKAAMPLIDNTRLTRDQRFALVLSDFTRENVRHEAVVFPGAYATQREAPTLRAVVDDMRRETGT